MNVISTLIADLVNAGVSAELVGRVAAALAEREPVIVKVADEAAERRREKDRQRKAVVRGNLRKSSESADSSEPYIARAGARVFPVGISNEIPKLDTPLPSEGPQEKKSEPKRSSGTALPEDWTPPEELFAYGAEHGLSRSQTAEILEDMRIWAVANRNRAIARKADWNLTARGFIRRDAAKFKARAGPPRGGNGFAALAVELARNEREQHRQTGRDFEALPLLSGGAEPGPGAGGDDDHGIRRCDVDLLIGNSFNRM